MLVHKIMKLYFYVYISFTSRMEQAPSPKRNKRLMSGTFHVGGAMVEREVSLLDGVKMDKHGLTLQDYT